MFRPLALAAALGLAAAATVPAAIAQPKPVRPAIEDSPRPADMTPDSLFPAIRRAFARLGCALPMEGGEAAFAEALSGHLSIPAEVLSNREGRWYPLIDQAIDRLTEQEILIIDRAAGLMRYPGCTG